MTIDAVAVNTATVTPASSGKPRPVRRSIIEDAWTKRLNDRDIRPSELRDGVDGDDRNLSYVAAILRAIQEG
jgi:hypothetical protein